MLPGGVLLPGGVMLRMVEMWIRVITEYSWCSFLDLHCSPVSKWGSRLRLRRVVVEDVDVVETDHIPKHIRITFFLLYFSHFSFSRAIGEVSSNQRLPKHPQLLKTLVNRHVRDVYNLLNIRPRHTQLVMLSNHQDAR